MPPARLRPTQKSPVLGQALGALSLIGQLSARREGIELQKEGLTFRRQQAKIRNDQVKQEAMLRSQEMVNGSFANMATYANDHSQPTWLRQAAWAHYKSVIQDGGGRVTHTFNAQDDLPATTHFNKYMSAVRTFGGASEQATRLFSEGRVKFPNDTNIERNFMSGMREAAAFQARQDGEFRQGELPAILGSFDFGTDKGKTQAFGFLLEMYGVERTQRDRDQFVKPGLLQAIHTLETTLNLDDNALSPNQKAALSENRKTANAAQRKMSLAEDAIGQIRTLAFSEEGNHIDGLNADFARRQQESGANRLASIFSEGGESPISNTVTPDVATVLAADLRKSNERIRTDAIQNVYREMVVKNPQLVQALAGTQGLIDESLQAAIEAKDLVEERGNDPTLVNEQIKSARAAGTFNSGMLELTRRAARRLDRGSQRQTVEGERSDVSIMAEVIAARDSLGRSINKFKQIRDGSVATLQTARQARNNIYDSVAPGLSAEDALREQKRIDLLDLKAVNTLTKAIANEMGRLPEGERDTPEKRLNLANRIGDGLRANQPGFRGQLTDMKALNEAFDLAAAPEVLKEATVRLKFVQDIVKQAAELSGQGGLEISIGEAGGFNFKKGNIADPTRLANDLQGIWDAQKTDPTIDKITRIVIPKIIDAYRSINSGGSVDITVEPEEIAQLSPEGQATKSSLIARLNRGQTAAPSRQPQAPPPLGIQGQQLSQERIATPSAPTRSSAPDIRTLRSEAIVEALLSEELSDAQHTQAATFFAQGNDAGLVETFYPGKGYTPKLFLDAVDLLARKGADFGDEGIFKKIERLMKRFIRQSKQNVP